MPHAAIDIRFHSNPKVLAAGNAAIGLYARALAYAADHLTDGFVPAAWVRSNGTPAERAKLLKHGFWTEVEGGYQIPDYLEYNLSKSTVEAKSQRGRKLADARWNKPHATQDAMRSALPNVVQNSELVQCPSPSPTPSPTPEPGSEDLHKQTSALDKAGVREEKQALVLELLAEINDRTELTDQYILAIAPKASEAALAHTIEALRRRRAKTDRQPLESESKYARTTLTNYVKTGGPPRLEAVA